MSDQDHNDAVRLLRISAHIAPTTQTEFRQNRPQICKMNTCYVSLHATCEGAIHIRHNLECFPIPEDWILDKTVNIWGMHVKPWLREREHAHQPA